MGETTGSQYPYFDILAAGLGRSRGDSDRITTLVELGSGYGKTNEKPNGRRNLFEEAKNLDILVKYKNEDTCMVPNTAFDVGMLDLTHPDTASWFKQILQEMVDGGVRGWMADFGEGLPVDASLYSGFRSHSPFIY